MDKENVIYTKKYYVATKLKEVLSYTTTEINMEDIKLNKIIQAQKNKYYLIPLICEFYKSQFHRC